MMNSSRNKRGSSQRTGSSISSNVIEIRSSFPIRSTTIKVEDVSPMDEDRIMYASGAAENDQPSVQIKVERSGSDAVFGSLPPPVRASPSSGKSEVESHPAPVKASRSKGKSVVEYRPVPGGKAGPPKGKSKMVSRPPPVKAGPSKGKSKLVTRPAPVKAGTSKGEFVLDSHSAPTKTGPSKGKLMLKTHPAPAKAGSSKGKPKLEPNPAPAKAGPSKGKPMLETHPAPAKAGPSKGKPKAQYTPEEYKALLKSRIRSFQQPFLLRVQKEIQDLQDKNLWVRNVLHAPLSSYLLQECFASNRKVKKEGKSSTSNKINRTANSNN